ncbi:MAG: hypothetical protein AAF654_14955, partial [Myxococcota bacterium]
MTRLARHTGLVCIAALAIAPHVAAGQATGVGVGVSFERSKAYGPSGPTPVFSVPFTTNANASDGTAPTFSRASTAYGTRVVGGEMELVEFGVNQPRVGGFIAANGSTQSGVLIEGSSETLALHSSIDGSQPAWTLSNCTTPLSAVDGPDPTTKARS